MASTAGTDSDEEDHVYIEQLTDSFLDPKPRLPYIRCPGQAHFLKARD